MGIRREVVISHPFSDELSSDGSSSPEREELGNSSVDSSDLGSSVVHEVSKRDTLAGLAIKYGVQIADIKRMNNLVSDTQMFAHKSLLIPLSSRYTPSPLKSVRSTPTINRNTPISYSSSNAPKSKSPPRNSTPSMSILQRYYNLKPDPLTENDSEMEMTKISEGQNGNKKDAFVRRRQKTENDSTQAELEDSVFTNFISKVLFPLKSEMDFSLCDPLLVNGLNFVKRSTSTSSLTEVISRPFFKSKTAID